MIQHVDYDRLVADYHAHLVETLRGFGPAADFLDLWVPDEDPLRSLANMLDAARAGGCPALEIAVGAAQARSLDRTALNTMAAGFGVAEITTQPEGGLCLTIRFDGSAAPMAVRPTASSAAADPLRPLPLSAAPAPRRDIPAAFAAAITAAIAADQTADRAAEPPAGLVCGRGEADGAAMVVWFDGDGTVHQASQEGAANEGVRGVLAALCRVIVGLPAQEAADHGVIRLERALRDFSQPPPVPGVVTPAAASPLFVTAERLLRGAIADWRARTGTPVTGNSYDEGPRPGWRALDDAGRRALLVSACGDYARSEGGGAADAEVMAIEYDVRVLIRFHGGLAAGDRQRTLMALERHVKRLVDPRLELHFEPAGDANRIRRLSGGPSS